MAFGHLQPRFWTCISG